MEVTQSTLPAQGWSSACLERGVVTWGLCSLVPSGLWAMDSMCNLCFFVLTDIASREKTSISVLKTRLQVTQPKYCGSVAKLGKGHRNCQRHSHKDRDFLLRPCKVFFPLTLDSAGLSGGLSFMSGSQAALIFSPPGGIQPLVNHCPPATGAAWRARAVCRKKG